MTPRFKEVIDAARMVGMDYKLEEIVDLFWTEFEDFRNQ
jgi:hypothetical protein